MTGTTLQAHHYRDCAQQLHWDQHNAEYPSAKRGLKKVDQSSTNGTCRLNNSIIRKLCRLSCQFIMLGLTLLLHLALDNLYLPVFPELVHEPTFSYPSIMTKRIPILLRWQTNHDILATRSCSGDWTVGDQRCSSLSVHVNKVIMMSQTLMLRP